MQEVTLTGPTYRHRGGGPAAGADGHRHAAGERGGGRGAHRRPGEACLSVCQCRLSFFLSLHNNNSSFNVFWPWAYDD